MDKRLTKESLVSNCKRSSRVQGKCNVDADKSLNTSITWKTEKKENMIDHVDAVDSTCSVLSPYSSLPLLLPEESPSTTEILLAGLVSSTFTACKPDFWVGDDSGCVEFVFRGESS